MWKLLGKRDHFEELRRWIWKRVTNTSCFDSVKWMYKFYQDFTYKENEIGQATKDMKKKKKNSRYYWKLISSFRYF